MAYTSRSEAEKARWIDPGSAVAMICDAEGLPEAEAQAQLLSALADGQLHRRWGDAMPPPRTTGPVSTSDEPPRDREFWERAEINWCTGTLRDDWGLTEEGRGAGLGRTRPLLIDSIGVKLIWPVIERRPDWWPLEEQSLSHWCAQDETADKAARERLKDRGSENPSEKKVCAELSAMWREAGREGGSPGTIESIRRRSR